MNGDSPVPGFSVKLDLSFKIKRGLALSMGPCKVSAKGMYNTAVDGYPMLLKGNIGKITDGGSLRTWSSR